MIDLIIERLVQYLKIEKEIVEKCFRRNIILEIIWNRKPIENMERPDFIWSLSMAEQELENPLGSLDILASEIAIKCQIDHVRIEAMNADLYFWCDTRYHELLKVQLLLNNLKPGLNYSYIVVFDTSLLHLKSDDNGTLVAFLQKLYQKFGYKVIIRDYLMFHIEHTQQHLTLIFYYADQLALIPMDQIKDNVRLVSYQADKLSRTIIENFKQPNDQDVDQDMQLFYLTEFPKIIRDCFFDFDQQPLLQYLKELSLISHSTNKLIKTIINDILSLSLSLLS